MSEFNIVQENGRFALYRDGVLLNTYSRKSSAKRRMEELQFAEFSEFMQILSTSELELLEVKLWTTKL